MFHRCSFSKGGGVYRRDFLMGVAAVPAVSSSLLSATRRGFGPNDTVRLGIIGVGSRGRGLMISAGFAQPDQLRPNQRLGTEGQAPLGIRMTAVCDLYDARAEWALHAAGTGAKRFRTHQELLASRDVDAVIVATPDHWHAPIVVAAARAGKHVYVEKCFTHAITETLEAVRAVKEAKIALQLGHQRRQNAT